MESFRASSVIGQAVPIWLKNFVPFTFISAVLFAPLFLLTLDNLALFNRRGEVDGLFVFAVTVGGFLLGQLANGAITYGVVQQLRGEPAGFQRCVAVGIGRMFPVFVVAIVIGIAIGFGYVYLAFPGFVLHTSFYVAVPAAVIEKTGINHSMKRSMSLTNGRKRNIFGLILLFGIADVLLLIVSYAFLSAFLPFGYFTLAALGILTITGTLRSVSTSVAYYQLRLESEGVDADALASVFD